MSKLPVNPKSVQDSSPLIDMFPGDTFNRTIAVLNFLQYSFTLANPASDFEDLSPRAVTGAYYVFQTVIDAIEKQAAALDAHEKQSAEVGES